VPVALLLAPGAGLVLNAARNMIGDTIAGSDDAEARGTSAAGDVSPADVIDFATARRRKPPAPTPNKTPENS